MTKEQQLIEASARHDALPGAIVLVGVRSLLWRMLGIALLATLFTNGSRSECFEADGSAGGVQCLGQNMHVSPFVYVGLFAAALWAISTVVKRGGTEAAALALFDRVVKISLIVVAAGILVSIAWFIFTVAVGAPMEQVWFQPFPFATIEITNAVDAIIQQ